MDDILYGLLNFLLGLSSYLFGFYFGRKAGLSEAKQKCAFERLDKALNDTVEWCDKLLKKHKG